MKGTVEINGQKIPFEGDVNILTLARSANIEIPTFCYHSQLSTYGACRLCIVEVEGWGIQASCSLKAMDGMKIKTHTEDVRKVRKVALELLLANHDQSCPTCSRSNDCKLRELSAQFGIEEVRFPNLNEKEEVDKSSVSLTRDPNKCILCGDCVRYCAEIQGVGVLDFANRGSKSKVVPAFGNKLSDVECVNCGGCAAVCPTGSITPALQIEEVWNEIYNKDKKVVFQIAPACRVSIGEMFDIPSGENSIGKMVTALRVMGADLVFDTSYAADLTVIEEGHEFLDRKKNGGPLPIVTSCCPGWVKFAEQFTPKLLPNLSSCKSPQQMFGSVIKEVLSKKMDLKREDLTVVSIMPCTAKKAEAKRDEFSVDGNLDVDYVLTTQEFGKMIKEAGIVFKNLEATSFDRPFGMASGAAHLFANSGGVSEAVVRSIAHLSKTDDVSFTETKSENGVTETTINIGGAEIKSAVVYGLANAKRVANQIISKEKNYDVVEVMACPGGCIAGAGQPYVKDQETVQLRKKGISEADVVTPLKNANENSAVTTLYDEFLSQVGGKKAHKLLHTHYHESKRTLDDSVALIEGNDTAMDVKVCLGTSCFVSGSQSIVTGLGEELEKAEFNGRVNLQGTFCAENCNCSPSVFVGDKLLDNPSVEEVVNAIREKLD